MKRKEIKAGVVYACDFRWGRTDPVVFLEDGAKTLFSGELGRRPLPAAAQDERPHSGNSYGGLSYGYLVLTCGAADVEALEGLDVAAELELARDGKPSAAGLGIALVTSLGNVKGPWAQVAEARDAARAAGDIRSRQHEAEMEALRARLLAVKAGFAAYGIATQTTLYGGGSASVGTGDAERLLALLAEHGEEGDR